MQKAKSGMSKRETQLENHCIVTYVNIHCIRKIPCTKFYALELYRFPFCEKPIKLQEAGN